MVVTIVDKGPGFAKPVHERLNDSKGTGDHGIGLYLVDSPVTEYGRSMHLTDTVPRK